MNETVLGLLSALAIYGLAALALPQPSSEAPGDAADISAEIGDDEPPDRAAAEGSDSQTG
jgi:hypothetical protein